MTSVIADMYANVKWADASHCLVENFFFLFSYRDQENLPVWNGEDACPETQCRVVQHVSPMGSCAANGEDTCCGNAGGSSRVERNDCSRRRSSAVHGISASTE